jgi:hypothetical protein
MNLRIWKNFAAAMSFEFKIEIPRDSWRQKKALFNWIDQHFDTFKECLNSLEFHE